MTFQKKDFDLGKYGAFFAFSDDQFKKWIWDNDPKDYATISSLAWLVVRKDTVEQMMKDWANHDTAEKERRLQEEWLEKIIQYELANYECYYTGSIEEAMPTLRFYWATEDQVYKVFLDHK